MEPAFRGQQTRAGLSVFACYNQLRREIQALLTENEELTRVVGQLREQRRQRHGRPGPAPPMAPSSAPPLGSHAVGGRFTFPGSANTPDLDLAPLEQSSTFRTPAWEAVGEQDSQERLVSTQNSSHLSSGVFWPGTGIRTMPPLGQGRPVPCPQRLSCPLDRFSYTGLRLPQGPMQDSLISDVSDPSLRLSELRAQSTGGSGSAPPSAEPQQSEARGHAPADSRRVVWEQLVGEVAFQLDRRIIARVFPNRAHLYGFTVANIPEKIMETALNTSPSSLAEQVCAAAAGRYIGLMARLRVLGYNPVAHPAFAEFLINTHGILTWPSDIDTRACQDPALLRRAVMETVPPAVQPDAMVLLECLQELAREDGQPLFLW